MQKKKSYPIDIDLLLSLTDLQFHDQCDQIIGLEVFVQLHDILVLKLLHDVDLTTQVVQLLLCHKFLADKLDGIFVAIVFANGLLDLCGK
jgi:hypothetical protein